MHLPEKLLSSLEGVSGFDRDAFIKVHQSGEQVTSVRFNPRKVDNVLSIPDSRPDSYRDPIHEKVPWTEHGYYLSKRPSFTFDPLFHAGCYYVQEASSMFLEQAIKQSVDLSKPLRVLDLCGAPGGKSTHIASLISEDSLLVSNEVIKARAGILKQNIIKWGQSNVIVTSNDPKHFSALEGFFDLIVIDAPCSGSGLFRREPDAINEWSPDNVALCSARQQRILADILPALKTNGILIYSTCSYSFEEDEFIVDKMVSEFGLEGIALETSPEWKIIETSSPETKTKAYRFYPDKLKGEGFFLCCLKNTNDRNAPRIKKQRTEFISASEKKELANWMDTEGMSFMKQENFVYGMPDHLIEDFILLKKHLYIQYAGLNAGEFMRDKFIPGHALALSIRLGKEVKRTELEYDQAIRYLQRNEMAAVNQLGWQTVCYKSFPLGWINALSNRVNNYYPKELRILKQENDSSFEK